MRMRSMRSGPFSFSVNPIIIHSTQINHYNHTFARSRAVNPLQLFSNSHFSSQCRPYSSQPLNSDDSNHLSRDGHGLPPDSNLKNQTSSTTTKRSSVVTFKTVNELNKNGIPITMLTAYDFPTARLVGMCGSNQSDSKTPGPIGIDICLCGDSLANVALGYHSTTELGLEEFTYHLKAVRRGLDSLRQEPHFRIPLLIADMPFGSYESSVEDGIKTATRLVQATRVDGFKIEGGKELRPLIERLTSFGIPVIGHIGLTPQRASSLGGFKVQGHDCADKAREIISDAIALEASGCMALVIEAVPIELISQLKKMVKIPLIGIGAGPQTDGQVLVLSDLIGSLASNSRTGNPKAKFVPNFSSLISLKPDSNHPVFDCSTQLILTYIQLVRSRQFPQAGLHTYSMKPAVLSELNQNGWTS